MTEFKTHCSHVHILSKKRPFSKKYCALMYFFSFFYEKPPAFIPIFSQKNVKSVISTLYYAKKSIRYPFFPILHEKNNSSYANILSKNVGTFSKNTLFFYPYFVNRLFFQIFMYFFPICPWKTPYSHAHIWSKKRQFWQKYIILWAKKVNRPFFPIFHKKILLSYPYFVENHPF